MGEGSLLLDPVIVLGFDVTDFPSQLLNSLRSENSGAMSFTGPADIRNMHAHPPYVCIISIEKKCDMTTTQWSSSYEMFIGQ